MTSIAPTAEKPTKQSTKRTKGEARLAGRRVLAKRFKHLGGSRWLTVSERDPLRTYLTDIAAGTCTCRASVECWHIQMCRERAEQQEQARWDRIQALARSLGLEKAEAVLKVATRTRRAHTDDLSGAPGYRAYHTEVA